jgi:hypothetical protein
LDLESTDEEDIDDAQPDVGKQWSPKRRNVEAGSKVSDNS